MSMNTLINFSLKRVLAFGVNSYQVVEVVEDMEVEDEVVGVREVMGEVGTGEAEAVDGREGE